MAYVEPTPASLKARFPVFAAVDDAVVQGAIDEAASRVDTTWPDTDYTLAKTLYAAHVLTLDGHGTSGASELIEEFGPNLKRYKANLTEVEFATSAGGAGAGSGSSTLGETSFGRRFREMRDRLFGGPMVTGGVPFPYAPNANDWPV